MIKKFRRTLAKFDDLYRSYVSLEIQGLITYSIFVFLYKVVKIINEVVFVGSFIIILLRYYQVKREEEKDEEFKRRFTFND